ncbi:hypothetical protein CH252_32390 [Rhodococcus sp. 06-1477-1B]|nr:hypothetical protein CH252_32390 [Rhodococcus sp. 06-1477-1B]
MRTDSLPRDAEPPSHISDVADLEVTRDQLIYLRRAELTGRSDSRRRLLRSPRLRRFQCELARRVTVAVFEVSVQQVHHIGLFRANDFVRATFTRRLSFGRGAVSVATLA